MVVFPGDFRTFGRKTDGYDCGSCCVCSIARKGFSGGKIESVGIGRDGVEASNSWKTKLYACKPAEDRFGRRAGRYGQKLLI